MKPEHVTKLLIVQRIKINLFFMMKESPFQKALNVMSTNEKDHMEKIFRAAYYLVKSKQAFKKFPLLIEAEQLDGIKFMESYKSDKSDRKVFINIAKEIKNKKSQEVACCHIVSFLCHGSTDLSRAEKELMYITFLDLSTHEVQLKFFSLGNAISQTSEGLMETFLATFRSKGVSDVIGKKILYFASKSATVNSGIKNGLITNCSELSM